MSEQKNITHEDSYYYVTTPIYYVNAKPHIGSAYTSIAADTLAKFMQLDGKKVKFLTGSDEHGQKIEQVAQKNNISPQEYVNEAVKDFHHMGEVLGLSQSHFIRTTDKSHCDGVQSLWSQLEKNKQIYSGSYAGWYAVKDEAFYNESELINGLAPTGAEVTWVEEPCYYFRLANWQEKLLNFYEKNKDFVRPIYRFNEVISFVKGGLNDLCISRTSFKWGIPVPTDKDHVIYVWIDALPNYITYLGYPKIDNEFTKYWNNSLHIIGKDILKFHAIYWPAILMALGMQPPRNIFAHGWWTNDGKKISKSTGNVIDPVELANKYGSDQVRYFLLSEVTFGRDANFSYDSLHRKINADLANGLGNLVQRVFSFVCKYSDGTVYKAKSVNKIDTELLEIAKNMIEKLRQSAQKQELNKMCEHIWQVVSKANKYVDSEQPWVLQKTNLTRMNDVLFTLCDVIHHIAICAQAIIPKGADSILTQLNIAPQNRMFSTLLNKATDKFDIINPQPIFPRIK